METMETLRQALPELRRADSEKGRRIKRKKDVRAKKGYMNGSNFDLIGAF